MTKETPKSRGRRKLVFGMIEQAANILGAIAASVLVVGLLVPAIAATNANATATQSELIKVALLVIFFSGGSAFASIVLRGLARTLEDDGEKYSQSHGDRGL